MRPLSREVKPQEARLPDPVIYLAYDAYDGLLYIGSTGDFPKREVQHRAETPWWSQVAYVKFERASWRGEAYAKETQLIHELRPRYNRSPGPPQGFVGHVDPRWLARDERIIELRQAGVKWGAVAREVGISEGKLAKRIRRLRETGRLS